MPFTWFMSVSHTHIKPSDIWTTDYFAGLNISRSAWKNTKRQRSLQEKSAIDLPMLASGCLSVVIKSQTGANISCWRSEHWKLSPKRWSCLCYTLSLCCYCRSVSESPNFPPISHSQEHHRHITGPGFLGSVALSQIWTLQSALVLDVYNIGKFCQ